MRFGYGPVRDHFFRLITYSLNVPGLPPTDNLGAVSHFWSLSVEEQFYLFWPMVVLFLPRHHLRRFLAGVIGLALLYKLSLALAGAPYKPVFTSLWGCLDSLGLGALLAIGWNEPGRPAGATSRWVQAGKIGGVIWAVMTVVRIVAGMDANYAGYLWFGVVYFAAAAVAFTGLIAFAASGTQGPAGKFLENEFMVQVGRISYGLYVYHFFMRYILLWMVSHQYIRLTSPWHYAGLSILMSTVAAVLSWNFIERPILRLKKYFYFGVRANAPPPPAR
jgi:peptidoglycan/LPS O-acetylase OafA/YrhL